MSQKANLANGKIWAFHAQFSVVIRRFNGQENVDIAGSLC